MTFTFRPAKREGVGLFIGLAGASGSGKTFSALRLARGIAGPGGKIAAIDTEARRMSHYSDRFKFDVADMVPPFRPERFVQAAKDAEAGGYAVLVIDSFSHEWSGEGGVLDWHDEELDRMAGEDHAKRERVKMAAWIKPKTEHKAMIASFLQRRIPIIFCMRAEDKVGVGQGGKPVSLGWTPVGDARFLYELTTMLTLMPEAPGLVKYNLPHKVQEQHRPFFPENQAITEQAGELLREWAMGGAAPAAVGLPSNGGADWPSFKKLGEFVDWSRKFLPTSTPESAAAWEAKFRPYLAKLKGSEGAGAVRAADELMTLYSNAVTPHLADLEDDTSASEQSDTPAEPGTDDEQQAA